MATKLAIIQVFCFNYLANKANRNVTIGQLFIVVIAIGTVIAAVLLIKQSATKFHLTDEQKAKVKARQAELEQEERELDLKQRGLDQEEK
ncbi:DUF2897 family protein [Thalassotalea euphylliae]|nr:DUF2897 family protein [Thalassotalea euphylliae]